MTETQRAALVAIIRAAVNSNPDELEVLLAAVRMHTTELDREDLVMLAAGLAFDIANVAAVLAANGLEITTS